MDAWGPAGSMLDSMQVLGTSDGSYRDEIVNEGGSIVAIRKEHGVHFFEVGADLRVTGARMSPVAFNEHLTTAY